MSARVLVTGATGFVGSHLAESLVADGYVVRLLVRDPKRLKWFSPDPFEVLVGDGADVSVIERAVRDVDVVIHCAGVTKTAHRSEFYRVNEAATRMLARAANSEGVKRFILCSTLAVCGPSGSDRKLTESDVEQPITDYGRSKLAGELAVRQECNEMEWITLRPPAVMGPRDEQFVPLFKLMNRWRIYTEVGRTARLYSIIGVHDLVRALKHVAFAPGKSRETYFVALPEPIAWHSVASAFTSITGKKPRRVILPELVSRTIGIVGDLSMRFTGKATLLNSDKVREILATGWACDVGKFETEHGFRCRDSLEDVVRTTYDFYVEKRWI